MKRITVDADFDFLPTPQEIGITWQCEEMLFVA